MDQVRRRREKYAQQERKRHREEIMAQKRTWIEPPSPVFEIPFRIQQQMWENFQTYLDSFEEKDLSLVDAALNKYLQEELLKHSNPEWNNESAVNILRILFRLQQAQKSHAKTILDLAFQARSTFQESNDLHAGNILLLLIKEIAIHLEEAQNNKHIWEGEIGQLLNQFVSTLKIYRSLAAINDNRFQQTFQNYRIFYIFLLADRRVDLQEFVRLRNVGELYYLIDDCINRTDSLALSKSVQLLNKMLDIKGSKEVEKCLDGVSVLLIEGVMQAKCFLNDEPYHKEQKGKFFIQFLIAMTSADCVRVNCGIELLARLFNMFDECISVALQVRLHPIVKEELITSLRATNYATFIELCLESFSPQVRWNCFWLISNITGSQNYYRQYGLSFLSHIYRMNYLFKQEDHLIITKEINICVLNYLCNITLSQEIQQLLEIRYEEKEIEEQLGKELTNIPIQMPNCLLFCIDVACKVITNICGGANQAQIEEGQVDLIHRAVWSLLRILENAEDHAEMVIAILERENINVTLEHFHSTLTEHCQNTEILDLITHLFNLFNTHARQL